MLPETVPELFNERFRLCRNSATGSQGWDSSEFPADPRTHCFVYNGRRLASASFTSLSSCVSLYLSRSRLFHCRHVNSIRVRLCWPFCWDAACFRIMYTSGSFGSSRHDGPQAEFHLRSEQLQGASMRDRNELRGWRLRAGSILE